MVITLGNRRCEARPCEKTPETIPTCSCHQSSSHDPQEWTEDRNGQCRKITGQHNKKWRRRQGMISLPFQWLLHEGRL